jgi:hypothetical protein
VRVGVSRGWRLDEPAGFDNITGAAHAMRRQGLGEPVSSDLLGFPVIVRGHDRIGLRRENKRVRGIRNEAFDANPVVVDDATREEGETGEGEGAQLNNP